MVNKFKFDASIADMLVIFYHPGAEYSVLEKDKSGVERSVTKRSNQYFEILYDQIKEKCDDTIFKMAVKRLILSAKTKRFPLPSEFEEAIRDCEEIYSQNKVRAVGNPNALMLDCQICNGTGFRLTIRHTKQPEAEPCTCLKGEKIKAGWIEYFQRRVE